MRYIGGKARIAKKIAAAIRERTPNAAAIWEPFCGGLHVSTELAKFDLPLRCSDASVPLIALYQAMARGWVPQTHLSEAQYKACKSLSDRDPKKALAGFVASFGGKWFGGYARGGGRDHYAENRRGLLRQIKALREACVGFTCDNFLECVPTSNYQGQIIYCDPPYAATHGYKTTGNFDHAKFWHLCRWWARCSSRVFVSEYSGPPDHIRADVVWSQTKTLDLARVKIGGAKPERVEYLYEVQPYTPEERYALRK